MLWPTVEKLAGEAVLVSTRLPLWVAATTALAGLEVTVEPSGAMPAAVAVSTIDPLSMSAWVTV